MKTGVCLKICRLIVATPSEDFSFFIICLIIVSLSYFIFDSQKLEMIFENWTLSLFLPSWKRLKQASEQKKSYSGCKWLLIDAITREANLKEVLQILFIFPNLSLCGFPARFQLSMVEKCSKGGKGNVFWKEIRVESWRNGEQERERMSEREKVESGRKRGKKGGLSVNAILLERVKICCKTL